MIKTCIKCGTEMVTQSLVDPISDEKKSENQCLHCGFTDEVNREDD